MSPGYILLVEDNPGDARLVQAAFEEMPGTAPVIVWELGTAAAVARLREKPGCAAVLLDLGLPDAQGLEALVALRDAAREVPVVVLSGNGDEDIGIAAVVAGAQDYLVKGAFDAALLRRSLQYATHRKRVEQELLKRSLHDAMTGLPTRALLLDRLGSALAAAARHGTHGALMFLDLDGFKQINDRHGHLAGDAVLRGVAERMRGAVRASDTVARVGGDEFVVLLPTIGSESDSEAVARKLLQAIEDPVVFRDDLLSVSASIGLVEFDGKSPVSPDSLIARADAAMYAAKREGRSTVRLG